MPISNSISAFGTLLKRGNGATPEVFTAIAEVGDIAGPQLKTQFEDATNHGSTNGFEESIPTTKSLGAITFPIGFIPSDATHSYSAGLVGDWYNKTKHNYQMVFPDSTTWTFACYVEQVSIKAPVKGQLGADITMRITGSPVLA
jgi:hypothetical protein